MRDRRSCSGGVLGSKASVAGFTLLELMIVVTILAIIATIGVPQYSSALRVARVGKSKHDLVTISHEIDRYAASNEGHWPLTLYQIGFGGKTDPWGTPYCYLNYADGTGDGLEWAIAAGLVDPSAFLGQGPSRPGLRQPTGSALAAVPARFGRPREASLPQGPVGGVGPVVGPRTEVIGPVTALAETASAATATTDRTAPNVTAIAMRLPRELTLTEVNDLGTLHAGSGFNLFAAVPTETTRRRDRYMFPLNTDYDLFSLGPDGRTSVSLGEGVGLDDVIRANNGGFYGSASDY